jgi:hypothetical protein
MAIYSSKGRGRGYSPSSRSGKSRNDIIFDANRALDRGEILDYYVQGDVLYYKDRYGTRRPYQLPSKYDDYDDWVEVDSTIKYNYKYDVPKAEHKAPAPAPQKSPLDWLFNEVEAVCKLARA